MSLGPMISYRFFYIIFSRLTCFIRADGSYSWFLDVGYSAFSVYEFTGCDWKGTLRDLVV
jgi:hypothetical protein